MFSFRDSGSLPDASTKRTDKFQFSFFFKTKITLNVIINMTEQDWIDFRETEKTINQIKKVLKTDDPVKALSNLLEKVDKLKRESQFYQSLGDIVEPESIEEEKVYAKASLDNLQNGTKVEFTDWIIKKQEIPMIEKFSFFIHKNQIKK